MTVKHHIKKILFLAFWVVTGAGIMVLLIAAIRERKDKTCRGYSIRITGAGEKRFMNEQRVVDLLKQNGTIRGRSIKRFDLESLRLQHAGEGPTGQNHCSASKLDLRKCSSYRAE